MQDFGIRRCGSKDLEKVRSLAMQTFIETFLADNTPENIKTFLETNFNRSTLLQELTSSDSLWYLAESQDRAVAYMKLNLEPEQTEPGHPDSLEIQRIYVLSDYKRKHIGNALIQKAIEVGRERNLAYIWLGVWEHNTRALAFYEKLGFKRFATHRFILGTDVQLDHLMKLPLETAQ